MLWKLERLLSIRLCNYYGFKRKERGGAEGVAYRDGREIGSRVGAMSEG